MSEKMVECLTGGEKTSSHDVFQQCTECYKDCNCGCGSSNGGIRGIAKELAKFSTIEQKEIVITEYLTYLSGKTYLPIFMGSIKSHYPQFTKLIDTWMLLR